MTPVLTLTEHPIQRCGAWAATVLADRDHPGQLTSADVERVARRVVEDVANAAVASANLPIYDWWKVYFALFPNSKATHAGRSKDRLVLRGQIAELFSADPLVGTLRRCVFCGVPSTIAWSKANMPMFDTDRALNTLPPRVSGWPVCRGCRVALWIMPYGAWVTAGSATVLRCDDPSIETEYVRDNVTRAARIRSTGLNALTADVKPERVVLEALKRHAAAPVGARLWTFKNDNQEPWIRASGTRLGTVSFLRQMEQDVDSRAGWSYLCDALTRRSKSGSVERRGEDEAARLLFDREGELHDSLLYVLITQARDLKTWSPRRHVAMRALALCYLKEIAQMTFDDLKPVTDVIATWICAKSSRGRYLEYRRVADKPYPLTRLLAMAADRLARDGRAIPDLRPMVDQLLSSSRDGWRTRAMLFFDVLLTIQERHADIAQGTDDEIEPDDSNSFTTPDDFEEESA